MSSHLLSQKITRQRFFNSQQKKKEKQKNKQTNKQQKTECLISAYEHLNFSRGLSVFLFDSGETGDEWQRMTVTVWKPKNKVQGPVVNGFPVLSVSLASPYDRSV